ncbi:hypothetical protein GTW67_03875, partial [Streptomyces sp. SID5910]|nr:hypothetical protein [Streptomyces sp. SID5910]
WFGGSREFPAGVAGVPSPDSGAAETEILQPQAGADLFGGSPRQDRIGQGIGQGRAPGRGGHRLGDAPRRDTDRTDVLPSAAQAAPTRAFPAPGPATAALRDPWQETPGALDADASGAADPAPAGGTDHTHDPHEVTVQLDAVQLGDGVIRRAATKSPGKHAASDGSDGPVFVDESGRRSRRFRRIGIALGGACAIYAVVIVSTLLSGNSNAPWLPVPGQQQGKPAGQVDTTPAPSQSAQPSASGSAGPGTSPSAGTGAATTPGADAPAPGTTAASKKPGTSADPRPSASTTAQKPGGGGAVEPDPTVSTQQPPPVITDPSTPAGGGETPVEPTTPTDGGSAPADPGGGTTVNGESDTTPVAAGTAPPVDTAPADTSTSPSLSPEYTL